MRYLRSCSPLEKGGSIPSGSGPRQWLLVAACLWMAGACGGSSPRPPEPDAAALGDAGADAARGDGAVAAVDRMPVAPSPTLGASCGGAACTTPFCLSTDPDKCGGNALTRPCVGRAAATYCTQPCNADSDCASSPRAMTCLTSCPEYSELAGYCWTREDAEFLRREVCPSSAAPDGGAPPPDGPTPPDAGAPSPDAAPVDGPPASVPDGGPAPTGDLVGLKFCNRLRRNGQPVDLTLEIGGKLRLQASSDSCAPPLGQACPLVPTVEFPVRLLEGTTVLLEDNVLLDPGFEYYLTVDLDGDMAFIGTAAFDTAALCRDTDPLTLPRAAQRSRMFRLPGAAGPR